MQPWISCAFICTPYPWGELVKKMKKKEAENNQGRRVRFKIIGKGGVTLEQSFRKSNPWKGEKCGRPLCFPCRGDKGGTAGGRGCATACGVVSVAKM